MKEFVAWLLSENNSELSIELFSIWHFIYWIVIFGTGIFLSFFMQNKSEKAKKRTIEIFVCLTVGLYIADFFLMPLSDSYGGISYDKLPFHVCTLMGVLAPIVQYNKGLAWLKKTIVVLATASSLMWMAYPGSALGGQPPFCFRTIQTFMFHGTLFNWGLLSLTLGHVKLDLKKIWQELCAIIVMMAWATLGNTLYDNSNWLFIRTSIFPFLSDEMMPPVVLFCILGTCFLVYCGYYLVGAIVKMEQKAHQKKNETCVEQSETVAIK